MPTISLPLLVALAVAPATPPTPPPALETAAEAWQDELRDAMRKRAFALAASGGSRNLLAAALLMPAPRPTQPLQAPTRSPEAARWFAAARAADPVDPLASWVEASDCGGLAVDCDPQAAIARLLAADPGNAAVHLLALSDAADRGDDAAVARHLHHAATADRYEPFLSDLLGLMFESRAGIDWPAPEPSLDKALVAMGGVSAPATADDFAAIEAFGRAMAVAQAGLGPVSSICPVDGSGHRGFAHDCMAVFTLVAEQSNTVIDQLVALVHLSRFTAGEPRGDRWREQLRALYWLQDRAYPLLPGTQGARITGGDYMRLFLEKGELGAMKDVVRRNGISVEPPADWLPDHPRMRALVTTGVPAGR